MRHPTAIDTKRAEQAQPLRPRQSAPVLECAGGDQLCLITRDAAIRTEALIGLLVASHPPRRQLDVLCAYSTAASKDRVSPTARLSGFARRVLECERTVCEPIAAGRSRRLSAAPSAPGAYAIGAPVRTPGDASGALCVGFAAGPPDPTTTLWVVESYARLASLCLHDADALDGLLAAGRFDALTGCLNHAAISAELEREIGRAARHRRDLSCCFVDLDHFKLVNDGYGHPKGSRVLAEVAAILRAGVRSADTVGRYGGDEFIVVLPDTGRGSAHALAERLRSLIRSANLIGGHEPLDASIGVAQWRAGTTAAELVSAADDALRAAKLAGGGNVVEEGDVAAGAGRGVAKVAR
jgi:diguanylate cyclase (GGDEF)-like protein